ncbi:MULTISPECIES: LysR family transcriptional regulator [Pseudoalteromonas]|uniref:LysR family transcriptional regulator n=1 Tax=Pseudoalteromonas amylolytica TaxID=1859457 RepID=A0A1S1MNT1_9GAMM|nr:MULTISPECIES: LysR family transcriptional regulator [Pseudoalteromonas]MCF6437715.1 LysR family transcriptional regulator [Pseudoalteromonas sp. MMG022]OHU84983.1 LysR family transcriptional regulator [Pseudoalteromonas sp. JW3]OHU90066.1 LysR family transcriptional regulator [Pseudoalteromonas amylolytica]
MDKLRAIKLFVRLADLGSFTRVAELTNSSKSMISKEISRLEENLGARLLHRTTRNVKLTHIGEGYLQRAREILAQVEDADQFAQNLQQNSRGKLKINAPMALGITDLATLFADFMQLNPEIELDIHLGDETVDLVEQGFDLGFRASSTQIESNYVGRPLRRFSYKICASPEYLKKHPAITLPQDLASHNCFIYSYFQGKDVWPIEEGVSVSGNLKVNSTLFMMQSIKRGLGIGFIPDFVCENALERGDVVEILPHTNKPLLTLYALYPARHFVPDKVVKCIRYLEHWFETKHADN